MSVSPRNNDVRKQVERFYTTRDIITLGHGGALIGRAACKRTEATVAVKYIPITGKHSHIRKEQRQAAQQEAAISIWLSHHPNIVQCVESFSSREEIVIIFEYCAGGDLLDYILKRGPLSEDKAKTLFLSIGSALRLCHDNGIAHRDIKLENIFLRADGTPVLGDFGMAQRYKRGERFDTRAGSPPYMAPEQLTDDTEDYCIEPEAADVFAFGVAMYAVLKGRFPFRGEINSEWIANLNNEKYVIGPEFSPSLQKLVLSMMNTDPLLRPTFDELLTSEWCQENQWECECMRTIIPQFSQMKYHFSAGESQRGTSP